MYKEHFLKMVAESGYNVGFGAKKHFATYDIVEKAPGWIGFLSLSAGIGALFMDELSTKSVSAVFTILGVMSLYIFFYDNCKTQYDEAGRALTAIFNELKELYYTTQAEPAAAVSQAALQRLRDLEEKSFSACISKQILFSDWYAHLKFFGQQQIEWIDEQKKFKLLKDKIPISLSLSILAVAIIFLALFAKNMLLKHTG